MSRVLVTGGAEGIGPSVVRRLLRDPDFEVRVSDPRPAPLWMREGASIHTGDLRLEAGETLHGCSHVIHLGDGSFASLERGVAVVRAALEAGLEHVTLVDEDGLASAAGAELTVARCRVHGAYGPGVDGLVAALLRAARAGEPLPAGSGEPVALTYVDDLAEALVLVTAAGAGGTFEVAAATPLRTVAELCWSACGNAPEELVLTEPVDAPAGVPSAAALEHATGWHPRVAARDGIARTLASLDHIPGGN